MTAPQSEPETPYGETATVTSRSLIRISQPNQCAMDGTVTASGLSRVSNHQTKLLNRILCRGRLHVGDSGSPFALTFRRATGYSDRIKRDATFPNCENHLKFQERLQTLKDINLKKRIKRDTEPVNTRDYRHKINSPMGEFL